MRPLAIKRRILLVPLLALSVLATNSPAQDDFLATSRDPYALYAADRYVRYANGFAGRRANPGGRFMASRGKRRNQIGA